MILPKLAQKRAQKRSINSGVQYEAFEPRKMLTTMLATISVGDLNSGVAVSDDASGTGFILYSEEDVHDRFSGIPAENADHFIAVRAVGNSQLQYNNDSQWIDFEPVETDIGVAEVNFDGDEVSHFRGSLDADNDLVIVANQFGGQFDAGEFQILGTQFETFDVPNDETPIEFFENRRISSIWNGVTGYEAVVGSFPTLANFDEAGSPLLSWRVHILPFIGHQNLYDQFRLDEAWNSPHNLPLADQIPEVFRSNNFESGNRTSYLAVAGEDTIFPLNSDPQGFSFIAESSLALIEVDASQSVIWTEPVDWYFDELDPLAGLGNASAEGFTAVDTNGRQFTLTDQIDPVAFANFVTINDGAPIDNTVFVPDLNPFARPALRDLGLALNNYESSFQEFPDSSINAEDGTPLLSWRVSILPFIGHQNLYDQFRLDEAWDSPHNIQLLENMPHIFSHPEVESGLTVYLGLDGDGTLFDSNRDRGINFGSIRDGASNTIAIVEADASQAVQWTRPVDLNIDPANPSNGLGGLTGDGTFNAVLADATVVNFRPTTAANLNAWLSVNGGEVNDYSFTDILETETTVEKLRNINLGLLNHESATQELPRTIYSTPRENSSEGPGVPLLSWRVAILPFIGESNLYDQFNLDEAWDSPHNLSLLPLIPRVFASEGVEIGKTVFQGAHGDNTVFSNTNNPRSIGTFDNNFNVATVLEVNSDQAIEWTRPGDFDFDPNDLSSVLGSALGSGFHVGFLDGSVEFFNNTISDDVLNKILSPADFVDIAVDFKVLRNNDFPVRFERFDIQNQLRQLALGVLNFESAFREFPEHAIYSQPQDGEPLLSWRVAILPFIGEQELFDRFNLDEAWDSPHNLSLLPLMPAIFKTVSVENGSTVFQAITSQIDSASGDRTVFPLANRASDFGDIIDGTSNTVLFVQVEDDRAVEWTRPDDLIYDPTDPTNGISTGTALEGTNVVLADGSTRFIPGNLTVENWRNLILANDGGFVDFRSPSSFTSGTIVPRSATGIDDNDTYSVTVTGDVAEISVNGVVRTESVDDVGSLVFSSIGGSDTLILNTGGIPVSVIDGVFQVGDLFSIETDGVETLDLGDSRVAFQGTDADDIWEVDADVSGQTTSISLNGGDAVVLSGGQTELDLDGGQGADRIQFSTDADSAVGYRSFISGNQVIRWENVDFIDVQGLLEQDTGIQFFDSVGDDLFSFRGSRATMSTEGLPEVTADGFSSVTVTSNLGGNDTARLRGNADTTDTFLGTPTSSRLVTPDVNVFVNEFDFVSATSAGGNDSAFLIGSSANESFFANPVAAHLAGAGFALNAAGFESVTGDSGGGDDTVSFTDSDGDDNLYIRPNFSHFTFADGRTITARNFASSRGTSNGGTDVATLVGSEGDDNIIGNDSFVTLSSDNFLATAIGFSEVTSDGLGGQDEAFLSDSAGDDVFSASPELSSLSGEGFHNAVTNFETVVALGSEGQDFAMFSDSAGNDRFTASPTVATLTGQGFILSSRGFDNNRVISSGGYDIAVFLDSVGDDRFIGTSTTAFMLNSSYRNEARGFSNVVAISSGGSDSANLIDSTGDDNFIGRNSFATLTGENYQLLAVNFDDIGAFGFNGGINGFFISETDFEWNRFGSWVL